MKEPGMTSPRCVVRMGSLSENLYLQKDGSWGRYGTARRFRSDAEAEPFCEPGGHGIFPCSVPRRLPRRD